VDKKTMSVEWYALHSKPNKEELLWDQLAIRRVETYYPRIRVQVINPRARKVRPYFPGYVFVHVDLERTGLSTLQWIPGAHGLVAFGGVPANVSEGLIRSLQNRVEEINAAGGELLEALKSGDKVLVNEGPFAGYEAIFDARISGTERVKVLLKFMNGRQTSVELPIGYINKKAHSSV
jgi:transcriptional antiterminator RfaH